MHNAKANLNFIDQHEISDHSLFINFYAKELDRIGVRDSIQIVVMQVRM